MINNIVFSGGGIKGLIFIGCLKYLEENNLLKNIKAISGTSIGGVFSFLLNIGYNSYELYNIFTKINYNKLHDISFISITNKYGLDDGKKFINFLKVLLNEKNIKENITFLELYKLTKQKLIITGTNISKQKIEYFNFENTPNMEILVAIRITISVPILYDYVEYNNDFYVDGGVLDDYPIHYFKNEIENTLGFLIFNYNKSIKIKTFDEYIYSFLFCLLKKVNKIKKEIYINSTILLEQNKIGLLDLDITDVDKEDLINLGYEKTKNFFENKKKINIKKNNIQDNILLDYINN
jgi:predicted acylesterase/phospholipase RssA